jgi:hypothetical protein
VQAFATYAIGIFISKHRDFSEVTYAKVGAAASRAERHLRIALCLSISSPGVTGSTGFLQPMFTRLLLSYNWLGEKVQIIRAQEEGALAEFAAEEFAVEAVGKFAYEEDFGGALVAG